MKFNELEISPQILRAVEDMGFEEATEIQSKVMPILRAGNDCIGQSQTGTGKTAAFSIPILERLNTKSRKVQVLIICPTRELSVQVCEEIQRLTKYMDAIKVVPVYGGEPIFKQLGKLKKGAQIVVGTPGRLIDHIKRKTVKLDHIETIILDEADEMLKMGFREDIEFVLDGIDRKVQTVLFSATFPKSIMEIAARYQEDPDIVKIKAKRITTDTILQQYVNVKRRDKYEAMQRLIETVNPKRCIVFCNTKSKVDELTDELQNSGYRTDKIHGDLKQTLRLNVLRRFNEGQLTMMVATDVAARGLDIQNVDLVINYDLPDKEEFYVHRIGRSGRAGKKGRAISLVPKRDSQMLKSIERYIRTSIAKIDVPNIQAVNELKTEAFLTELMTEMDALDPKVHEAIMQKLFDKGYTSETIAMTLLNRQLVLKNESKHKDLNDNSDVSRIRDRGRSRTDRPKKGKKSRDRDKKRLFISVGKKDKVRVADIVGAIAGETGVSPEHIGAVDMFENFSFADVNKDHYESVIKKLNKKKIKGKKVSVELANQ